MQFFHQTNIDFVGKRQIFFIVSIAYIVIGLSATIFMGVDYGIDFEGGTEIAVKFEDNVSTEDLRATINEAGITGTEIKSFGGENQYLIRVKLSENMSTKVKDVLNNKYGTDKIEILKEDNIGPRIGKELREQAFLAVILSVIAILIYIAFRFEFVFGLGAVVALIHDVIVTFSALVIFHHAGILNLEIDSTILAAMLTVVGFSINDTVIIFDRIRENKEKMKGVGFIKMVNISINETLSRTVNTVGTVLIVLITLVAFGGPVLQGFAFTMLAGIITGTYSSIFIASSFVIWYLKKVKGTEVDEVSLKTAKS